MSFSSRRLKQKVPFIYFNCAEYFNNPELLTSHLFGYKKGSFTGADNDHQGLVELADGGFFFLDEVHRLTNEGQEKLFTLLDKGYLPEWGSGEATACVHQIYFCYDRRAGKDLFENFFNVEFQSICIFPAYLNVPSKRRSN